MGRWSNFVTGLSGNPFLSDFFLSSGLAGLSNPGSPHESLFPAALHGLDYANKKERERYQRKQDKAARERAERQLKLQERRHRFSVSVANRQLKDAETESKLREQESEQVAQWKQSQLERLNQVLSTSGHNLSRAEVDTAISMINNANDRAGRSKLIDFLGKARQSEDLTYDQTRDRKLDEIRAEVNAREQAKAKFDKPEKDEEPKVLSAEKFFEMRMKVADRLISESKKKSLAGVDLGTEITFREASIEAEKWLNSQGIFAGQPFTNKSVPDLDSLGGPARSVLAPGSGPTPTLQDTLQSDRSLPTVPQAARPTASQLEPGADVTQVPEARVETMVRGAVRQYMEMHAAELRISSQTDLENRYMNFIDNIMEEIQRGVPARDAIKNVLTRR